MNKRTDTKAEQHRYVIWVAMEGYDPGPLTLEATDPEHAARQYVFTRFGNSVGMAVAECKSEDDYRLRVAPANDVPGVAGVLSVSVNITITVTVS